MATARALTAAENALREAERRAIAARGALQKASVRDGRLMSLMPSNDPRRKTFEDASRNCVVADRVAHEARARLERLRSANGGGAPSVKQARLDLAAAIEAAQSVHRAAMKNKAVIDCSYTQSAAARKKLEAAERAVARAGDDDVEAAAQAVAHNRPPPALTLAKAQAKVADAESAVEQIRVGRQRLEQKQGELERAHEDARRAVWAAIDNVLRAELPLADLLATNERLTAALTASRLALRMWAHFANSDERRVIQQAITALLPGTFGEGEHHFNGHPVNKAIAEMRAALEADAAAPIEIEL
jgi:DNA repair exonuclease SbcCD ATPase subunit